mmetsp:Transcript_17546/g.29608  ORF Transcript_17546/g.29608 Transcript_17546/m.29608 type:complete len:103 (+) Transcript_17546:419-727(+)
MELTTRDRFNKLRLREHAWVKPCLEMIKHRQNELNAKHISQTQVLLDRMQINDPEFWQRNSLHTLKQLHLYSANHLAQFLDLFDKEVRDVNMEKYEIQKCSP